MSVISLTTDFGLRNGFVGVLKGVIYGIAPDVTIVDVSHAVAAQDVREGALVLWRTYSFFPKDTVHVYVVDPGVGTKRRAIAARLGEYYFVGPDNGFLTPVLEDAVQSKRSVEFVHLDKPTYWLPKVSRTFHGRDIFSPVAAHLANGAPLQDLGSSIDDPVRIEMLHPEKTSTGWKAHVTMVDIFGNLSTDLPAHLFQGRTDILFRLQGVVIHGIVESYGHRAVGELVALVDSEDYIELAEVNGSAAKRLNAKIGDVVEVLVSE